MGSLIRQLCNQGPLARLPFTFFGSHVTSFFLRISTYFDHMPWYKRNTIVVSFYIINLIWQSFRNTLYFIKFHFFSRYPSRQGLPKLHTLFMKNFWITIKAIFSDNRSLSILRIRYLCSFFCVFLVKFWRALLWTISTTQLVYAWLIRRCCQSYGPTNK